MQPGPIFRLNALTGENQQLANGVFWIGVSSDLQARSLAKAPEASVTLAPTDMTENWFCREGLDVACIQVPPGWESSNLPLGTTDATSPYTITNLVFQSSMGWSAQVAGTIRIEIHDLYGPGGNFPDAYFAPFPAEEQGNTWEPITIDGVHGIHILSLVNPSETEVILPLTSSRFLALNIIADVEGGFNNPIVQRILQSIKFK